MSGGAAGHPVRGAEVSSPRAGLPRALAALCITEITSWGVLYYAFPVMLPGIVRDTGWRETSAMGAFSAGLVVSALAGVPVGRLLDRYGPRPVMTAGSAAGVAAALAIAAAPSLPWFFAAWALAGLAQSALLYTPAFAALTRWYGPGRVRALTTLSLVAGLSSTVFAPLSAVLAGQLGWRVAYVMLAVLLGAITIPLHALCLSPAWPGGAPRPGHEHAAGHVHAVLRDRAFPLLVAAMVLAAFGLYAATVDLVPLLTSQGSSGTLAAIALGLVGAGQIPGRVGYAPLARRTSPRTRTAVILMAGAAGVALLAAMSRLTTALLAVALIAGAARGLYTLLQATAVSDRWGTRHFPTLNGIFAAPVTIAVAVAPVSGSLLAGWLGSYQAAFYLLAALILTGAVLAAARAPGSISPGLEVGGKLETPALKPSAAYPARHPGHPRE